MPRRHIPFDQSWRMPIELKVSRGVRCGDLLFTCGQVDLDRSGRPQRPADLRAQSERALEHLRAVLAEGGMAAEDLVQLHVFYRDDGGVDPVAYRAHLRALIGRAARPVLVLTPIPAFFYPGVEVEIDAIAVAGSAARSLAGSEAVSFPAAVRAGDMVVARSESDSRPADTRSPVSSREAQTAIDRLAAALRAVGADLPDLCKVTITLSGVEQGSAPVERLVASRTGGTAPVSTTVLLPASPRPRPRVSIEGFAVSSADGRAVPREVLKDGAPILPRGLRCRDLIFAGGHLATDEAGVVRLPGDLAGQTHEAMTGLSRTLGHFGAGLGSLVKVNTYYRGGGTPEELHSNLEIRSGYYVAPGPASTGMPLPALHRPGAMISIDAIASAGSS